MNENYVCDSAKRRFAREPKREHEPEYALAHHFYSHSFHNTHQMSDSSLFAAANSLIGTWRDALSLTPVELRPILIVIVTLLITNAEWNASLFSGFTENLPLLSTTDRHAQSRQPTIQSSWSPSFSKSSQRSRPAPSLSPLCPRLRPTPLLPPRPPRVIPNRSGTTKSGSFVVSANRSIRAQSCVADRTGSMPWERSILLSTLSSRRL